MSQKAIDSYLEEQGILYRLSADFADRLEPFGFPRAAGNYQNLMKVYLVLIEDYELSALRLIFSDITIIGNRPSVEFKNKIRSWFSWFLK